MKSTEKRTTAKNDLIAIHNAVPNVKNTCSTELKALSQAGVDRLRERYTEIFRRPPSASFGPDLLRKSIAYEIQCRAYGRLSPTTEKQLRVLVKQFKNKPNEKFEISRKIKIGVEFARSWKGKMHRVVVLADGYGYAGKTYASLSEIARLIAGTRWSGPRFFGLRSGASNADQS